METEQRTQPRIVRINTENENDQNVELPDLFRATGILKSYVLVSLQTLYLVSQDSNVIQNHFGKWQRKF